MRNRLSIFDSPLLLGFEQFERALDRVQKSGADGYPPYNIEQTGENGLRITLAVAGFTMDDLDVEIEQSQLVIRGRKPEEGDRMYLHRGIAARQFQRSFVLADGVEVTSASLDNGLLHIDLVQTQPEQKVRKIAISQSRGKHNPETIDVDTHAEPKKGNGKTSDKSDKKSS